MKIDEKGGRLKRSTHRKLKSDMGGYRRIWKVEEIERGGRNVEEGHRRLKRDMGV